MARKKIGPSSKTARSSAATRNSSRRSRSAKARTSAAARRFVKTFRPMRSPFRRASNATSKTGSPTERKSDMCGIIGYIGPKEVVPVLIDGLRRLEYRGYDSAGVAVVRDGHVDLRRSAGKLSNLEDVIGSDPISGDYGVGPTPWAAHGRAPPEKAHPHPDRPRKILLG